MRNGQVNATEPFRRAVAITLSDSTTYVDTVGGVAGASQATLEIPDAWYVGTSAPGNLVIVDMAGNTTTLKNLIAGQIYYIRATKFKSASTTVADLVALYY